MKRTSTGISGLDDMLGGGVPTTRVILVHGGPGSGKTVLSLQFLVEGAHAGEKGIYVTLEEPLPLIKVNMLSFGWDLAQLETRGLLKTIDGSHLPPLPPNAQRYGSSDTPGGMVDLARQIRREVEGFHAKRLVIDPLTSAVIHQRFPTDKRIAISQLFKALRALECTSLVTSEYSAKEGEFYLEEYLADGVIRLSKTVQNFQTIKTLLVEKMRGIRHDDHPRRFEVLDSGLMVYNTEPVTP